MILYAIQQPLPNPKVRKRLLRNGLRTILDIFRMKISTRKVIL